MKLSKLIKGLISSIVKREKKVNYELSGLPEGSIRFSKNHNSHSFFYCTNDSHGEYIKRDNSDLISQLSTKEYLKVISDSDTKLLKILYKLAFAVDKYDYNKNVNKIHSEKLKFVKSSVKTDIAYAMDWANAKYEKLENDTTSFPTLRNNYARSKSEVMIMNFMDENNIFYRYEQVLHLKNGQNFAPDFTLLNPETREVVYWEHFGMMDNPDYFERAMFKLSEYQKIGLKLGVNFFFTIESSKYPFTINSIKDYLLENFKADDFSA